MTLGKGHLAITIPLFLAAMAYNVWYFTMADSPATARRVADAAPSAAPAAAPSVAGEAAPVDPVQLPPVRDVELDRLPQWRRNPFASTRPVQPFAPDAASPVATTAVASEAQPDIVVSAILISSDRRRARVNGRTVRVGDRVGDATIVEIQPQGIVVESPAQGRRTIVQRRGVR